MADTNNILSSWNSKKDDANNIKIKNLDNRVKKIEEYIDEQDLNAYIEKFFLMQRTGKIFTSKFPLYSVSQSSKGIKIDDNENMVCMLSTQYEKKRNDYNSEPMFRPIECNWKLNDNGKIIITALENSDSFSRDGSNGQVGIINMPWYVRYWIDNGYWYISITDTPRSNYIPLLECFDPEGKNQGFMIHSKYSMVEIAGYPYSASGFNPVTGDTSSLNLTSVKPSLSTLIPYCKKINPYYTAKTVSDLFFVQLHFLIKYANLNFSQIFKSDAIAPSLKIPCEIVDSSVSKNTFYIQQNYIRYFAIGQQISISNRSISSETVWSRQILDIQPVQYQNYYEITVDGEPFIVKNGDEVQILPWKTGSCDNILSTDGQLKTTGPSITSPYGGSAPILIGGIEMNISEIIGNAKLSTISSDDGYLYEEIFRPNQLINNSIEVLNADYTHQFVAKSNLIQGYISKQKFYLESGAVIPEATGATSETGFATTIKYLNPSLSSDQIVSLATSSVFSLRIEPTDDYSMYTGSRISPNGMCKRPID